MQKITDMTSRSFWRKILDFSDAFWWMMYIYIYIIILWFMIIYHSRIIIYDRIYRIIPKYKLIAQCFKAPMLLWFRVCRIHSKTSPKPFLTCMLRQILHCLYIYIYIYRTCCKPYLWHERMKGHKQMNDMYSINGSQVLYAGGLLSFIGKYSSAIRFKSGICRKVFTKQTIIN